MASTLKFSPEEIVNATFYPEGGRKSSSRMKSSSRTNVAIRAPGKQEPSQNQYRRYDSTHVLFFLGGGGGGRLVVAPIILQSIKRGFVASKPNSSAARILESSFHALPLAEGYMGWSADRNN